MLYARSLLFTIPVALFFLRRWLEESFGFFDLEQLMFHLQFGGRGLFSGDTGLAIKLARETLIMPLAGTLIVVAGLEMLAAPAGADRAARNRSLALLALAMVVPLLFLDGFANWIDRASTLDTRMLLADPYQRTRLLKLCVFQPAAYSAVAVMLLSGAAWISRFTSLRGTLPRLAAKAPGIASWALMLAASLFYLLSFFPLSSYASLGAQDQTNGYLDRNYVAPDYRRPLHARNLVLIYVESLESTYRDVLGRDSLVDIDRETRDWSAAPKFTQVFGTGWTTAALVATQCGLPLRPPVGSTYSDVNKHISSRGAILSNAVCLGDLLHQAGYVNVFMTGAALDFGGVGEFIANHGYERILGREEWIGAGERELTNWGLPDDRLFRKAEAEFDALLSAGTPFNLTVLTIDNHGPHGILNDHCKSAGVTDFLGIVACNAGLAASFIHHVREMDRQGMTDIVVMGDHLAMENPVSSVLNAEPERYVYDRFLSGAAGKPWRGAVTHFDFFPSILEMLGFTSASRRAGLGTSFVGAAIPGFQSPLDDPGYDAGLREHSALYTNLWKAR